MSKIFYEAPQTNVVELNMKSSCLLVVSDGGPGKSDEEGDE